MTLQAADPHSLLYPKIGWYERTGVFSSRIVLSHDEVRLAEAHEPTPSKRAFVDAAEAILRRRLSRLE